MGILSINRNLLNKFKPKSLSSFSFSSDLSFYRRILSRIYPSAAVKSHVPTNIGDMKPKSKSMFLIDHVYKGINNLSLFSVAAAENNNSWEDHFCSPFSGRPGTYRLVGSCKEWTLFWPYEDVYEDSNLLGKDEDGNSFYQYQRRLILWNPTTNCVKTLPPSPLPRPRPVLSIDIECFGLGFDPKSEDYKLICFLRYYYTDFSDSFQDVHIELYSPKTNLWKPITPSFCFSIPDPYHSVHVNGVYYWASTRILSFDFAYENFYYISLPPHLIRMRYNYCLAEFHGSLAIIIPYWVPTEDLTEEEQQKQMQQPFSIEIWVWNGETWNVAPKVAVGDFPVGDQITMLLGLFQNEYLFLQSCNELMLFNCKTGKLENLGIPPASNIFKTRPFVFPFPVSI